jgi:hypothetical protein
LFIEKPTFQEGLKKLRNLKKSNSPDLGKCEEKFFKKAKSVMEIHALGQTKLARIFYLLFTADMITLYLSVLRRRDLWLPRLRDTEIQNDRTLRNIKELGGTNSKLAST